MAHARSLVAIAVLSAALASVVARSPLARSHADERVRLVPHFSPGQTLLYEFDIRTETTSHSTGPIVNPEAASKLELSINSLVRLDIISVEGGAAGLPGRVRMLTTYEKCAVTSHSDAFDPQQQEIEERYRKLAGRSFEFTLEPDGKVSDIAGLEELLPNRSAADIVQGWLSGLSQSSSLPAEGIAIGQKWSAERPVVTAPLAGLVWHTESTYLRDEPCLVGAAPASQNAPQDSCAIILSKFEMDDRHMPSDPTPELYRRNSLRTSGKWSGSGESLSAISLRTGLVVSVTQTGTEEMDVTIASASEPSRMHYAGRIHTESHIALAPPAPAH